jgi:hypothetical protein
MTVDKVSLVSLVSKESGGEDEVSGRCIDGESPGEYKNLIVPDPGQNTGLTGRIRDYIAEEVGTFTGMDIDNELGLSYDQKAYRAKVMSKLCAKGEIRRVRANTYERCNIVIKGFDLNNINTNPFDISLPFGLDKMVTIPRKAIILIAGSSNAGKTQFMLETMKLNIRKKYKKVYMITEAKSEYAKRVMNMMSDDPDGLKLWADDVLSVDSDEEAADFAQVVAAENVNGLSILDYLDVKGEFYEMTKDITRIYRNLVSGVAVIALQKKNESTFGMGGEFTIAKPRLYLSLSSERQTDHSSLVSLKIVKAKECIGGNHDGKEIHLKVSYGCETEILSAGWVRMINDKDRKVAFDMYESESDAERKLRLLEAVPYDEPKYVSTDFTPEPGKVEGFF